MMHKRISILSVEHPYEAKVLKALLVIFAILIAGYLYFVGASVLNIIARKEASAQTIHLRSAVAAMEKEYFSLRADVSPALAAQIGLSAVVGTDYVYRPGQTAAVTMSPNEI